MAREIPGFGGFSPTATGELVAYVTDPGEAGRARAALAQRLAANPEGAELIRGREVQVKRGDYSFTQLCAWRDVFFNTVLDMPGVVHTSIDESSNRVRVGVENAGVESRVRRELGRLGVPPAAVIFETTAPIVPTQELIYAPYDYSAPFQQWQLDGYHRPLVGGLKVSYRVPGLAPDHAYWCTFGFNANLNDGTRVAFTNAHCSQHMWSVDNTHYFQATLGVDRFIGYETRDPNASSCGFLSVNVCRDSDASAMYIQPGVPTSRGFIANTLNRVQGPWNWGTLVMDGTPLRITAKQSWAVNHQIVDKVGARTGRTYGAVFNPCVDVSVPGRSYSKLRCQTFAYYTSRSGDSGSPVFRVGSGHDVTLAGINWGAATDGSYAVYSPLGGIEKDFGPLAVIDPAYTPPPPPPYNPPPCVPDPGQLTCVHPL